MSTQETTLGPLIFPHHQHTRLHVSLRTRNEIGELKIAHNSFKSWKEDTLEGSLRAAQREVVEHEVFSVLVREAPNLSTASARVSQRLIVIDAAQNMELIFELVRASRLRSCCHPHVTALGRL
jgi:mediator of RNA polymerase II transcription subunit 17